jgi:hypothetical protein
MSVVLVVNMVTVLHRGMAARRTVRMARVVGVFSVRSPFTLAPM